MRTRSNPESVHLADQLKRSVHGGAWHGPALEEAIAGLDAELAAREPREGGNSILKIVEHLAFWMETADARLHGQRRQGAADWSDGEGTPEERWARAGRRVLAAHHALHATVQKLSADDLDAPVPGSDPTARGLILGVLQHNAYHTAQIGLLARRTS